MELESYLKGVVAAEMPASFEKEALKAQAVAARSYALYKSETVNPDHPDASVCTDSTHCKAYISEEKAMANWGKNAKKNKEKISLAVDETKGEILTYQGDIALTVFHSQAGGGRTENASDVWGGNLPYLVSVESHGEETAPNFFSSAEFTFGEFCEKIRSENPAAVINSPSDIGKPELSAGGSVKTISIGGQSFKGSVIRSLFGLRSACFSVDANENTVRFDVTGYGHGVGMSQYGANEMAKNGYDYKSILTHYYSGTALSTA